jgi:hypothetical protein
MPITLPQTPDGHEYEDFLAATLQVQGYFIETRLTLREDNKEVLELDVVASPSGEESSHRILYEAKKDGFHFRNLFKLYGQRVYLKIPNACLVSLTPARPKYLPVYEGTGNKLDVRVCHFGLEGPPDTLAPPRNAVTDEQRDRLIAVAWYQQIARRLAIGALLAECKQRAGTTVCDDARDYVFNVRASFFQDTPLARAEALYNAYFNHQCLSGDALALTAEEESVPLGPEAWKRVNDRSEWLWIQGIMYLESAARFIIVKNALDDFLVRGGAPPPEATLKIGSLSLGVPLHALPSSFHAGLEKLRDHEHGLRIPYLFQVFFDLFGGFLFSENEGDLGLLAAVTGIPQHDLVGALRLIDEFFAPDGASMLYEQKGQLLCLKMTPAFVRGGGAFTRKVVFDIEDYATHYPEMGWLVSRWHNSLYEILEPALRKD